MNVCNRRKSGQVYRKRLRILSEMLEVNSYTLLNSLIRCMLFNVRTRQILRFLKMRRKEFKDESIRDRREMNKRWGEIANSLGIIVEDLVSPAVRPAIKIF